MNSGAFKSSVGRCAVIGKFSVLVLSLGLGLMPRGASAAAVDVQFNQYLQDICTVGAFPPSWDSGSVITLCTSNLYSGVSSPGATYSTNLGTVNALNGANSRKKTYLVPLDDQKEKKDRGASADGEGWGLLMSPQYSNSNRVETELENGYQSDLSGLVVGLDYRFSDSFVLGLAVGQTKDNADFNNNAGYLKSSNNTATVYGTWLLSERVTIDGYLGYGKLKLDNQRKFILNLFSGTMSSNTTGRQTMAGLSISHQANVGRFNFAPSMNLDYIKTTINSYNESGSGNDPNINLLALHYGERSVTSLTSNLGGRLSTTYGYDWGALVPLARLGVVHEFQNKTRQISNELVITHGTGFLVETDAPDRNYLNIGLGLSAAFNGGTLLFLDYDKRSQDKLLSSWAVSLGALMEF